MRNLTVMMSFLLALAGCADDGSATATTTTPSGPVAKLRSLASKVADARFNCKEPELNDSPDGSNRYSAAMACSLVGRPSFHVRIDDPDARYSGESCSSSDHPWVDSLPDVIQADLIHGEFLVEFEVVSSQLDSNAEGVRTLEGFARAAGWIETPNCQGGP